MKGPAHDRGRNRRLGGLGQSHRLARSRPQRGPRRGRRTAAMPGARPTARSRSSSPPTRRSARSTPPGAARTRRPTSSPSRWPTKAELAGAQLLGDIVLAHGVCAAEAADKRHRRSKTHAAHLVVHGTLHLLGYDHETSDARRRGDGGDRAARARVARHRRSLSGDRGAILNPWKTTVAAAGKTDAASGAAFAPSCSATTASRRCATRSRKRSRAARARSRASATSADVERQMLRNILHFGEKNAGDVAVPRGDIIAVPEHDQLRRAWSPPSPRPATAACRSTRTASTRSSA